MTDSPTEQRGDDQRWEQPTFDPAEPPVTGEVLPTNGSGYSGGPYWSTGYWSTAGYGATGVGNAPSAGQLVVAQATAEEQTIMVIRRLVWPVALVIAIVTGSWIVPLVLAIVVSRILSGRVRRLRWQRLAVATGSAGPATDLR